MSSGWRNSQVSFQPDCLLFFNYRRSSAVCLSLSTISSFSLYIILDLFLSYWCSAIYDGCLSVSVCYFSKYSLHILPFDLVVVVVGHWTKSPSSRWLGGALCFALDCSSLIKTSPARPFLSCPFDDFPPLSFSLFSALCSSFTRRFISHLQRWCRLLHGCIALHDRRREHNNDPFSFLFFFFSRVLCLALPLEWPTNGNDDRSMIALGSHCSSHNNTDGIV